MAITSNAYYGAGVVSMGLFNASNQSYRPVGNSTGFTMAINEDVKILEDRTQPAGGTWAEARRVTSIELTIKMVDFNKENLIVALLAGSSTEPLGSAVSQALTDAGGPDRMLTTNRFIDDSLPITLVATNAGAPAFVITTPYAQDEYLTPPVANGFYYKTTTPGTSGGVAPVFPTVIGATVVSGTATFTCAGKTTLVLDTDYEVRTSTFYLLPAAGLIDGELITASYSFFQTNQIEALITGAQNFGVLFEAENNVNPDEPSTWKFFKVKLGAAATLDLLADDFGALEIKGSLQSRRRGQGLSSYFIASTRV
jgi:hypothetical protein